MKVRFVDLGLVEDVPPSSLCQIPKEFVDIPFQVGFKMDVGLYGHVHVVHFKLILSD